MDLASSMFRPQMFTVLDRFIAASVCIGPIWKNKINQYLQTVLRNSLFSIVCLFLIDREAYVNS